MYNAKSDIWNKYLDNIHKIVSPGTYNCDLCSLTHGGFSEKKVWKGFRKNSNFEFVFMYKNEFLNIYANTEYEKLSFPVILQKQEKKLVVLFDSEKLATLNSVEELVDCIEKERG